MLVAAVTAPPCIESNAFALPNPVPTTVTVVPTEAVDGLTTVTVGASTVNGTELKLRPAVIVCRPLAIAAGTVIVTTLVETNGHAWAAPAGVPTVKESRKMLAGCAPKYVTVAVEVLAPDDGETDMMLLLETMTVTIVDTEVVPSLTVIEY